jgi:biopolymer transport protein ExbB
VFLLDWLSAPFLAVHNMRILGGPVVDWILTASVILWGLVFERYWYFSKILPEQSATMVSSWRARAEHRSWKAMQIRKAMLSRLNSGMTANLALLKVMVPLCPLLGLLGTVSGMLDVFDSMAARGSADARSMANGVSEAMVCTLGGLAVSITGLYPVYYFTQRARKETQRLVEKFAG